MYKYLFTVKHVQSKLQTYSCVSNNSLVYNKWFSWGIFKDPRRLLDTLLNKFIKIVPNKQFFGAKDPLIIIDGYFYLNLLTSHLGLACGQASQTTQKKI